MDIEQYKQQAKLIRDNEIYKVYDLQELKDLTLSLTELYPDKSTTGHSHDGIDEICIFISGEGAIEIGEKSLQVKEGDAILIPQGEFHKVRNQGKSNLNFWNIFEKYEGRGK